MLATCNVVSLRSGGPLQEVRVIDTASRTCSLWGSRFEGHGLDWLDCSLSKLVEGSPDWTR